MENFFYEENFFTDTDSFLEHLELDIEDANDLPDNFEIEVEVAKEEPIVKFSVDWIVDRIYEERIPDDDDTYERLRDIIKNNIDFDKLNSEIPKAWYGNGSVKLTKKDFI